MLQRLILYFCKQQLVNSAFVLFVIGCAPPSILQSQGRVQENWYNNQQMMGFSLQGLFMPWLPQLGGPRKIVCIPWQLAFQRGLSAIAAEKMGCFNAILHTQALKRYLNVSPPTQALCKNSFFPVFSDWFLWPAEFMACTNCSQLNEYYFQNQIACSLWGRKGLSLFGSTWHWERVHRRNYWQNPTQSRHSAFPTHKNTF